MAIHFDGAPNLSRLDVAIRLKADLLRKLSEIPPVRWGREVGRFVSALERSGMRDPTALVVLLAELCEELRALIGVDELVNPGDLTDLEHAALGSWSQLPPATILAQFNDAMVRALLPATRTSASLSPLVQQTKALIDGRYAEPLTLAQLADAVGRSKRYLGTVFREEVGLTAHEYLTRVRLRRALELIREGQKIEAVSLLVGYRSKANFYHHFKTQLGITPVAYRAALFHVLPRK